MGTVLLATDGSEYTRRAAERAIELAGERDVSLRVICVVDQRRFDGPALSSEELATIYVEDHAAMCVTEVMEMAQGSDVTVTGDTRHGISYEVVLDYADEVDAAFIVIGERWRPRGTLLGSGTEGHRTERPGSARRRSWVVVRPVSPCLRAPPRTPVEPGSSDGNRREPRRPLPQ